MSAKPSFKRAGEMQDGINTVVAVLLERAKSAHKNALNYKKKGWDDAYWKEVRQRGECLWMIRFLLLRTTNGVLTLTCVERRSEPFWAKQKAKELAQAQEVAA